MTDAELAADLGPVYDRQGQRITIAEYRALQADPAYRVVAVDREGSRRVSTVWFGTDRSDHGLALTMETMVFDDESGAIVAGPELYGHEDSALDGHARACREHLGREPIGASGKP